MDENKPKTIQEEAGLGPEWQPVERGPIIPSAPPAAQQQGPGSYFAGPLSPVIQHDAAFYQTKYGGAGVPETSLMPPSTAVASNNASTTSTVKQVVESGVITSLTGVESLNTLEGDLTLTAGSGIAITQPSSSEIIISATTPASVNIIALKHWGLWQGLAGTTLTNSNALVLLDDFTTASASATEVAIGPNSTFGAATQIKAGTGSGGGLFNIIGAASYWAARNPYFAFRGGFNASGDFASASDSFIWLCLSTGIPASTNFRTSTPTSLNLFGFLYNSAASTNWQAVVGVAGVYTSISTGIAADAKSHLFESTVNSTGGTTSFSIDGVVVASISAVPTQTVALAATWAVGNLAAATVDFNLERFYAQSDS